MKASPFSKATRIGLTLSLVFISLCQLSYASNNQTAGREGNGGDICEDQIKVIGADIDSWIAKGGPDLSTPQLDLSRSSQSALTLKQYSQQMSAAINRAHVGCVSAGDASYPVMVGSAQKTCKNFVDSSTGVSRITCDRQLFKELDINEQYRLIHHEYAGLAGVELPNGDDSSYSISNQISAYLQNEVVKRLAIRHILPPVSFVVGDLERDENGTILTVTHKLATQHCKKQGLRLPTIRELALWAKPYGAKISETKKEGYIEVDGQDSAGNPDTFYYNNAGFHEPKGDLAYFSAWSSSIAPARPGLEAVESGVDAYILYSDDGAVDSFIRSESAENNAIRCLREKL